MSHFTTIQTKIFDKDILIKTLEEMGFKIIDKKHLTGYRNRTRNVDFQIQLEDSYNIGFAKIDDSYHIIADWYGVYLKNMDRNKFTRRLTQNYALNTVKLQLKKSKYRRYRIVAQEESSNNSIKLILKRRD